MLRRPAHYTIRCGRCYIALHAHFMNHFHALLNPKPTLPVHSKKPTISQKHLNARDGQTGPPITQSAMHKHLQALSHLQMRSFSRVVYAGSGSTMRSSKASASARVTCAKPKLRCHMGAVLGTEGTMSICTWSTSSMFLTPWHMRTSECVCALMAGI